MESMWWMITFWVDRVGVGQAPSIFLGPNQLERVNRGLRGRLLDFTNNHGEDRRIWSASLQQKRDLYVYVPPGFDRDKRYPLVIFLHGAAQDEEFFLQTQVERIDRAIVQGKAPPAIIAAPDGSVTGKASMLRPATFFTNSRLGNFEDYLMKDVWQFLMEHFPILPEGEAHALVGASMGGSAAFALAIKHRPRIKAAVGFYPLLNLRYVDDAGKYRSHFDPLHCGQLEEFRADEPLGRRRFFTLRFGDLFEPLFGHGQEALDGLRRINPLDLMEEYDLQPGELDLYVAYGGKDEFNIAAQVESFLWRARQRGLHIATLYDPNGRHDLATSERLVPHMWKLVAGRLPAAHYGHRRGNLSTKSPSSFTNKLTL